MLDPKKIIKSIQSFDYFVNNIFCLSFEEFFDGEFVTKTANFLQNHLRTVRVSAKDHFKSTSLYAYFMWDMLRMSDTKFDMEAHYFSYKGEMSAYHIGKIKDLIKLNPYFQDLIDLKTTAEGVIKYRWSGRTATFTLSPQGLLGFKRGLHCNWGVFVDDPFQDPANKLEPKIVRTVNYVMKTQIIDIPNRGAFLHVVGTPQTKDDFFFDKKFLKRFEVRILPAIVDYKKKISLWPEHYDYQELIERKSERGEKIFNQEYMCSPVYSENSFFSEEQVLSMMFDIPNYPIGIERENPKEYDIIGGWDLGKHRHPAHFSVFEVRGDKEEWIQIHQHFFDGEDYKDQLEYIDLAIENFGIDRLYYDATRGEIEVVAEKGELGPEYIGVNLGLKKKNGLATEFDKRRTNGKIKLIADDRQRRSILSVQNDLKAIETPEGHGDAFWSIALAMEYLTEPRIGIY